MTKRGFQELGPTIKYPEPCCAVRAGAQALYTFFMVTLWWQIGNDYGPGNVLNLAGIFFFWIQFPAFSCAFSPTD